MIKGIKKNNSKLIAVLENGTEIEFGDFQYRLDNIQDIEKMLYIGNHIQSIIDIDVNNVINKDILNIYLLNNKHCLSASINDLNDRLKRLQDTGKFNVYIENTPDFFYKDITNENLVVLK